MSMRKLRTDWLNLLLPLCLAASGCDTGTSTDTTNTLTGVVKAPDGSPAAGAWVTARSGDLQFGDQGGAAWNVLGEVRADDQGRFTLPLHVHEDIYLEASTEASMDLFFTRYPMDSLPKGGSLGELKLAFPGTLRVRIADSSLQEYSSLWVGAVGFPVFSSAGRPDDSGGVTFDLQSVPGGMLEIRIIAIPPDGNGQMVLSRKLPEVEAKSGAFVDVGTLRFRD
jgi:hypothetical protein